MKKELTFWTAIGWMFGFNPCSNGMKKELSKLWLSPIMS